MYNTIQHFEEIGIKKIEEIIEKFIKDPTDMASFVTGIREEVVSLGLSVIQETLEDMDNEIRSSNKRKEKWSIVRKDEKQLKTSLGDITFKKTLFKNKKDSHTKYLLDTILGMPSHERLTEDAEQKLLEEAVESSYRKAGETMSLSSGVSKQTVKNKIHALKFKKETKVKYPEKKQVDFLYIDADEDHVSLQFQNQKGDLEKNEWGRKKNCMITKLVYVYEGIGKEAPMSKRHCLINPYYFSGAYAGTNGNEELWASVYDFLNKNYDLDDVKKIFLNGDGGAWIKAAGSKAKGITYVIDEFHLKKYMLSATAHLLDSADEARKELITVMKKGTKEELKEIFGRIRLSVKTESAIKRINDCEDYFLSNWMAIRVRLTHRNQVKGCSAEGHVSHVLSGRMSSRPMGWSRTGADKMAQLLAYSWNGGDMLELVRYQRQEELAEAAGAECDVISSTEMLLAEKNKYGELGKYVSCINHHVDNGIKKYVGLSSRIWNL